jgi:preprotein translocase subunit SecE
VAKVSPIEFMNQVGAERRKITWPTRRETLTTAIFVLIMTTLLSFFFFGVDALFHQIVQLLLSLIA